MLYAGVLPYPTPLAALYVLPGYNKVAYQKNNYSKGLLLLYL